MGTIGKIIKHFVSDSIREIVTEIFINNTKTSVLVLPPGIDACPILGNQSTGLNTDQSIILEIDNAGHTAVIGVIPPGLVSEGEIRILGRNITTGAEESYILCKTNGNVELNGNTDFAVRFLELQIAFNQLKLDFDLHTHAVSGVTAGSATVTSAITIPSTADISTAKVDTVLLPGK